METMVNKPFQHQQLVPDIYIVILARAVLGSILIPGVMHIYKSKETKKKTLRGKQ